MIEKMDGVLGVASRLCDSLCVEGIKSGTGVRIGVRIRQFREVSVFYGMYGRCYVRVTGVTVYAVP